MSNHILKHFSWSALETQLQGKLLIMKKGLYYIRTESAKAAIVHYECDLY